MCKRLLAVILVVLVLMPAAFASEEILCQLPVAVPSLTTETPGSDSSYLGCLAADAVRDASGADVALVNSGDLVADLPDPAVTRAHVRGVFAENRPIAVAELSVAQLTQLLEHGLSRIVVDLETETIDREASHFDGFLQVSGLKVTYDASAGPGARIYKLALSDGTKLDLRDETTTLTVAAAGYLFDGGYGFPVQTGYTTLDVGLADALEGWISVDTLPTNLERVVSIGTADNTIVSHFPMLLVLPVLVAAMILLVMLSGKRQQYRYLTKPMKRGEASRYLT